MANLMNSQWLTFLRMKPTKIRRYVGQMTGVLFLFGWVGICSGKTESLSVNTSLSPLTEAPSALRPRPALAAQTILFVDDSHVLYRAGTKRVLEPLHRAEGNPLIKGRDKPWEVAIAWMSVYRNPVTGKYQLWYQAFAGNEAENKTRRCTVCYAESDDGINFIKPNLRLFDYNGNLDTNIVLVANGGTSDRYGVSVVVDPEEKDVMRRYKMAHYDFCIGEDGQERPGLSIAFSPDGILWTKVPGGPISRTSYGSFGTPVPMQAIASSSNIRSIDNNSMTVGKDPARSPMRPWDVPLAMSDALDAFWDSPKKVFSIYGKMWIDGPDGGMYWKHAMGRIESKDFIHWSKPQLLLTPDDQDPASVEYHTTPVFYYADYYFSALQILDRATNGGIIDIELATSRDGLNWRRDFRQPFWLARTVGEAFDSGSLFLCPQPIVLEDEIRFYYGAYSAGATGSDDHKLTTGIGMASMPRDRFAGLQTGPQSAGGNLRQPLPDRGQITLKLINFKGNETMQINAKIAGSVRVELLDAAGKRVEGYTFDDAVIMQGDALRHEVKWQGGLVHLPQGEHLIRIHLNQATVYALSLLPQQ